MKNGLICLQYWDGDKDKAMRLAKFIADLEPSKREDVDFMFMARADSSFDEATATYVSRKFHVRNEKPKVRAAGHPYACWVTFFSVLEWVYLAKLASKCPAYKWVLCFEPDCVPLTKDWITELSVEWDRLNKTVVGSETFHWQMHLNGNAMYSADMKFLTWFVKQITVNGCPKNEPYDLYMFPQFARWGVGYSRKIANRCGQKTMTPEESKWLREKMGIALCHGVKDDSLHHWAATNVK